MPIYKEASPSTIIDEGLGARRGKKGKRKSIFKKIGGGFKKVGRGLKKVGRSRIVRGIGRGIKKGIGKAARATAAFYTGGASELAFKGASLAKKGIKAARSLRNAPSRYAERRAEEMLSGNQRYLMGSTYNNVADFGSPAELAQVGGSADFGGAPQLGSSADFGAEKLASRRGAVLADKKAGRKDRQKKRKAKQEARLKKKKARLEASQKKIDEKLSKASSPIEKERLAKRKLRVERSLAKVNERLAKTSDIKTAKPSAMGDISQLGSRSLYARQRAARARMRIPEGGRRAGLGAPQLGLVIDYPGGSNMGEYAQVGADADFGALIDMKKILGTVKQIGVQAAKEGLQTAKGAALQQVSEKAAKSETAKQFVAQKVAEAREEAETGVYKRYGRHIVLGAAVLGVLGVALALRRK